MLSRKQKYLNNKIMETLTISRIIFLVFIVILSVYFVHLNKSLTGKEHFSQPLNTEQVAQVTKDTIRKEFKREATPQEITFFQAYAIEKKPTEQDLVMTIKSSTDIVNKAYEKQAPQHIALKEAYGTEDEVTEVYNDILMRLPDDDELLHFSRMLKEDKSFNLEKLKQMLYGSEEYQRLEKTQSNQVYSNLIGGVTDRQITLIVTTHYKKIVGKDAIDPSELHFLKKKLLEFNMDEALFKKFLESYIKNQPFNQQLVASQKAQQFIVQKEKDDKAQSEYDKMKKELYTQLMSDLKKQSLVQQEQPAYTTPSKSELPIVQQQPNKQVIEVLLKTSTEKENYLDSSDVLDTIKQQSKCVFDKNMFPDNQNSMAKLIDDRNKQTLKDTCVRNRTYLGLDEDLTLDPTLKWTVPQRHPPVCVGGKNDYKPLNDQTALIGTLLEDAKNTKVGSVVDFYPPR
jgi:hypothetical protein